MKVGEEQLEELTSQHTGDCSGGGCGRSWALVDCLCPQRSSSDWDQRSYSWSS